MTDATCIVFAIAATLASVLSIVAFVLTCGQFFLLLSLLERLSRAEVQVNNALLPKVIPENMEPGVYVPRTDPITKETTYVKEGTLTDFEKFLGNSSDTEHDQVLRQLDNQINAKRQAAS